RLEAIENERAARSDSRIHPPEQPGELRLIVPTIKKVVDALADRSHRIARRWPDFPQRGVDEPGSGRLLPGQRDHRLRNIDAQNVVSGTEELPRPDAAAAAEIDHQPFGDAAFSQHLENGRRGLPGKMPEADIVDVR